MTGTVGSQVLPVVVAGHVACGVVAVASGATAMLARKGSRRHRHAGRAFLAALAGACVSAPVLAARDWAHHWPLVVLGAAAACLTALAVAAIRRRRRDLHLAGMGAAYILMLTAFYVDNGPRLPLWDRLPPALFWVLPAVIGAPVVLRALRRERARAATTGRRVDRGGG